MNPLKWLRGPSSISTGYSEYLQFTPIEAARLKGKLRKVVVGGRKVVFRRTFMLPWVADEVTKAWTMDASAETMDGQIIRVNLVLGHDDMAHARDLVVAKLLDTYIQQRLQELRKAG